jgi:microcystin-dependent protein
MGQSFVGEIRMFGGNFAPAGWAFCDGRMLPISENEVLFQLIGTTYGGDGQSTFGLPDLQGRVPVHQGTLSGSTTTIGEQAGSEQVTLTVPQITQHTHPLVVVGIQGSDDGPGGNLPAISQTIKPYINGQNPDGTMHPAMLAPAGGSQPHDNRQPYLAVSFIISLFGLFPSQS